VLTFGAVYLAWNQLTFVENKHWPYPTIQGPLASNVALGAGVYAGVILLIGLAHLQVRWASLVYWNALDAGTCCCLWCCSRGRRAVRPACSREPCCCYCRVCGCCSGNKVGAVCWPDIDPFTDGVPAVPHGTQGTQRGRAVFGSEPADLSVGGLGGYDGVMTRIDGAGAGRDA